MTGKRAERTKHDFWCSICRSAIGQDSCLICARRCQLTFCSVAKSAYCGIFRGLAAVLAHLQINERLNNYKGLLQRHGQN